MDATQEVDRTYLLDQFAFILNRINYSPFIAFNKDELFLFYCNEHHVIVLWILQYIPVVFFEIRIIKAFEDRIVKTAPGHTFNHGKKEKITVTYLDISLHDLKNSPVLKEYRHEHNSTKHYFSENGKTIAWVPAQKLDSFLSTQIDTLVFSSDQVKEYMKYGFRKIKATVSKNKIIRHDNCRNK